ncbi:MAG TPA: dihydroneopterin aldolase [Opitutaceae bacterium]|jgi:dihydroneopterin aldolase|nr:dihydroneopterin aldolase [Opitutaceae bacterium]
MNGQIHLKNMVFYGYHGHLAEENSLGQRFMIDLVMTLDIAEAARTDDLRNTVDYVKVYGICRQIVEHDRVKLLETLANHLIDRIFEACPRVTKVGITIKKPSVPMDGVLDYVAVETSKEREHGISRAG